MRTEIISSKLINLIEKWDNIPTHFVWIYIDNIDNNLYILCNCKPTDNEKDIIKEKLKNINFDIRNLKFMTYEKIIKSFNDLEGPLTKKIWGSQITSLHDPYDIENKCKNYLILIDAENKWIDEKYAELTKWLNTKQKKRRDILWMNYNGLLLLLYLFKMDNKKLAEIETKNMINKDKFEILSKFVLEHIAIFNKDMNEYNRVMKKLSYIVDILSKGDHDDIRLSFICQQIYTEWMPYNRVNYTASSYVSKLTNYWPLLKENQINQPKRMILT